jgi:hypothetical protein
MKLVMELINYNLLHTFVGDFIDECNNTNELTNKFNFIREFGKILMVL